MGHPEFCNCEDCWWANGQRERCGTCGAFHDDAAPRFSIVPGSREEFKADQARVGRAVRESKP